jgi:serine protease Do
MKPRTSRLSVLAALALLAACADGPPPAEAGAAQQPAPPSRDAASTGIARARESALVTASARVAPSVVSVNVTRRERRAPRDPFDMFFTPQGSEQLVQSMGSGFIASREGLVITNQHVTAGAEEIIVTTRADRDYPARLLGEDPLTDIAVLKIEGNDVPAAPLGSSTDLRIGEWVVAIGKPYAYLLGNSEPTVTAGVVSALGRNLLPSGDQAQVYVGMIQTDAAINPGNSGGPLINAVGEVVGVNSSIFSSTGGSVGIGFAIPIERALRVADELQRYGSVRRAWVGLEVGGAEDLRAWKRAGGLRVTQLAPDGPGARGGIAQGDVLLTARGRDVRTFLDWEAVLLDAGPGDTLVVTFRHDSRERTARIIVGDLPSSLAQKVAVLGDLQAVTLTPSIRQERAIRTERGALIAALGPETQQATGLRPGDLVFQINRTRVESAEDLQRALKAAAGGGAVTVWFERARSLARASFTVK